MRNISLVSSSRPRPITLSIGFFIVDSAAPKNSENTKICRISLVAMASTMLRGNTCVMKALRVKSPVFRPDVADTSGSARFMCTPGWKKLTSSMPSASDVADAHTNQIIARRPTRPTERPPLMLARPVTRGENTSGAMIILIMRRKMSVMMLKYEAMSLAAAASLAYSWQPQPTAMPSSIASPMWEVRRLVFKTFSKEYRGRKTARGRRRSHGAKGRPKFVMLCKKRRY